MFGFISTIIFTRVLGADLLGVYYLFLAYFSIFNVFSEFGLGNGLVKKISEGEQELNYFSAYFTLRMIFLVAVTILLLCLMPTSDVFLWVIIALCVSFFSSTVSYWILGTNKFSTYNLSKAMGELVRIILSIGLVLIGFSVGGLIGAFIVGLIFSGVLCLKYFKVKLIKPQKECLIDLFKFSTCIAVVNFVAILIGYSDTVILSIFGDTGDIGVYRVVLQFASVVLLAANAYNTIIYPKLSFYAKNDMVEFNKILSNSIICSLVIGIPCCFGGILLGEPAIFYLYGVDFVCGTGVFCVLLMYYLLSIFSTLYATALSAKNQVFVLFKINIAVLVVNMVLNVVLFYLMGIVGIAISSLICVSLQVLMEKKVLGKIGFNGLFVAKICFSTLIMCIVLVILGKINSLETLILNIGVGVCVYFIVLLLIGKEIFIMLKT